MVFLLEKRAYTKRKKKRGKMKLKRVKPEKYCNDKTFSVTANMPVRDSDSWWAQDSEKSCKWLKFEKRF